MDCGSSAQQQNSQVPSRRGRSDRDSLVQPIEVPEPVRSRRARWRRALAQSLVALGLISCAASSLQPRALAAASLEKTRVALANVRSGIFSLLTYNVAGLPAVVSAADPASNTPRVSPLLNHYDVVLAQEDFAYHEELVQAAEHPYQLEPQPPASALVGNGLSTLSVYPVEAVEDVEWEVCNGYLSALSDCLSEKGFSFARMHLSTTATVDVYNVHADAGTSEGDVRARAQEFEQLALYMRTHSQGRAVLLAGDTNLEPRDFRDQQILRVFLSRTGLSDACEALNCAPGIDRVFTRSTRTLKLSANSWSQDGRFVDENGKALSDHPAVGVQIAWSDVSD